MRTFFIIAVSALLLAAVIVELSSRLWPDNAISLLILATLALVFQGYLSLRFARPTPAVETGRVREVSPPAANEQVLDKPKLDETGARKRDIPIGLWTKCPRCGATPATR